jgi:hypothetical protein
MRVVLILGRRHSEGRSGAAPLQGEMVGDPVGGELNCYKINSDQFFPVVKVLE